MRYTAEVALSPMTYRFTVKDYHRMAEADIFEPDDRVELVDGKVFELAPIGSRHAACVKGLAHLWWSHVGERAIVSVQDPIQVGEMNEPQPDVAILRLRTDRYVNHHPAPPDIYLVIEVAETSLRHDLDLKTPLYLAGGVAEVWVVDLVAELIHVTTPAGTRTVGVGGSLAPAAFPDLVLEVAAILGAPR
jgi:Uma2 family endonuclease